MESKPVVATTQQRVRQELIPQFAYALAFPPAIVPRLACVPATQIHRALWNKKLRFGKIPKRNCRKNEFNLNERQKARTTNH